MVGRDGKWTMENGKGSEGGRRSEVGGRRAEGGGRRAEGGGRRAEGGGRSGPCRKRCECRAESSGIFAAENAEDYSRAERTKPPFSDLLPRAKSVKDKDCPLRATMKTETASGGRILFSRPDPNGAYLRRGRDDFRRAIAMPRHDHFATWICQQMIVFSSALFCPRFGATWA